MPRIIANLQPDAIASLIPLVGYADGMPHDDPRVVLASNLRVLLDYARDRHLPYADAKSLARKAGLTPSTVGHWLKAENAAQIDKLERLASVFKLRAWQLLIPNLDPANPPAVPYTDAERRLYWRIKAAARELAQSGAVDEEALGGSDTGHDPYRKVPTERHGGNK
jgi:transcriptional regulator with XRE-family HTH domain